MQQRAGAPMLRQAEETAQWDVEDEKENDRHRRVRRSAALAPYVYSR